MILLGDALETLRTLESNSVQTCVTSPPYWGLRDYGVDGQIGLEKTPEEYVDKLVKVFREVRRVLKDDGTLWLNLGDSYFSTTKGTGGKNSSTLNAKRDENGTVIGKSIVTYNPIRISPGETGLKPKDLVGIPWRVAFALQSDGWYLRQDIIWHKQNPLPESVRDRCTKAHEYIFLLTKSARYFFDNEAIKEPATCCQRGSEFHTGKTSEHQLGRAQKVRQGKIIGRGKQGYSSARGNDRDNSGGFPNPNGTRNKRSVWTVRTKPFKGAHFATFPPDLIEPCILAGSRPGDVVLDPFAGSGTTGVVCKKLGRNFLGIEINPEYRETALKRIEDWSLKTQLKLRKTDQQKEK